MRVFRVKIALVGVEAGKVVFISNVPTSCTVKGEATFYCDDCGEKLYYGATNNYKREQAFFFCSSFRRDTSSCKYDGKKEIIWLWK